MTTPFHPISMGNHEPANFAIQLHSVQSDNDATTPYLFYFLGDNDTLLFTRSILYYNGALISFKNTMDC